MNTPRAGLNDVLQRTSSFPNRHFLLATDLNDGAELAWFRQPVRGAELQGVEEARLLEGWDADEPAFRELDPDPEFVRPRRIAWFC